jgi:hypothetical protein
VAEIFPATAFVEYGLFLAALRATGSVLAALGTRGGILATTAVTFYGGFAAGALFMAAGRAAGGHQDACGKHRSQDRHCFHVCWFVCFAVDFLHTRKAPQVVRNITPFVRAVTTQGRTVFRSSPCERHKK